jgi:hypothetical protein
MFQFVVIIGIPPSYAFSRVDLDLRDSPLPDLAVPADAVFLRGFGRGL